MRQSDDLISAEHTAWVRRFTGVPLFFFMALGCAFLLSCTTRSTLRVDRLVDSTLEGDYLSAVADIQKHPKLYGKQNTFLYHMDIGVLYHYAGMYDSSTHYLQRAADIFNDLFARSVTNEAASIMVNDNIRPYRSKPYELVMLHQFLALNYLAAGDAESALVESRRVQLLFDEWERKNRDGEKYAADGMFNYISSIAYDAKDATSDAMISLFNAVKAFQAGPVPLPGEIGDRACHMFTLNDRESDNALLNLSPVKTPEEIGGIANHTSEIVVIGYAGRGPVLEEESWWGTWVKNGLLVLHHNAPDGSRQTISLPAPGLPPGELRKAEQGKKTKSGTTFHVKVALPALRTIQSETGSFTVSCSGFNQPFESVVINDLDLQAGKQLEDSRGRTIARTVARVVLRTIAAQKTKQQLQTGSTAANLLLNIGTDILAGQLEKADTRSCFLLPQTVQIVRIPVTPGSYSLTVTAHGDDGPVQSEQFDNVTVAPHEKKFLLVSSFR